MTTEMIKDMNEIAKQMVKWNLTEEMMKAIIEVHGGDVKKTLITLKNWK